jgi:uncharacterized protein involved in outer membrane biogenesis
MYTVLKWLAMVCAFLVVCVLVLFFTVEWWGKSLIARQASSAIGRKVVLDGDLDIPWSWMPQITIDKIRVVNAAWSPEPFMATLQRLSFQIDLRQLLQGRVVIPQVELLAPVVRLESSEQGIPNWLFAVGGGEESQEPTQATAVPTISQVAIRDGRISYEDFSTHKKMVASIAELTAETTGPEQTVSIKGAGDWETQPFQLDVHAGSLAALQAHDPYPLQAQLQLGLWRAELAGTLVDALQLAGVDLDVTLEGVSPEGSPAIADTSPPEQQRKWLQGHLTHQEDAWALEDLNAVVGKNQLAGRVTVEIQEVRPFLRIDLSSPAFDVDNAIATLTDRQGDSEQKESESDTASSSPVIDLQVTRAVNGVLQFQSQTVTVANQKLQDVTVAGRLEDGRLTLQPTFAIAEGEVRARIEVADREGPLQSDIQADIQHVNLEKVLANLGTEQRIAGMVQGDVALLISGRTLAELLESVDGQVSLTMTDADRDTDVTVKFATLAEQPKEGGRLVNLLGEGRVRGQPLQLKGQIGSFYALQAGKVPYPVQVDMQLGETQARVDGTVSDPRQFTGLTAQVALTGPDPATLSAVLPLSLPHLPAYQVEAHVTHTDNKWTIEPFQGSIGNSDLEGTLALDISGEPFSVQGKLRSQRLQLDEFKGVREQQDQADQKASATADEAKKRVIPEVAISSELLRRLNADLHFQGKRILGLGPQLQDISAAVQLRDGNLKLTPRFRVGGGTVETAVEVVARTDPMKNSLKATFKQVDMAEVLRELASTPAAFGKLNGHIGITGMGHSLPAFLSSANGDVSMNMAGGRLDNLLTELVGLDVGEAIVTALVAREASVLIRCLVADFIVSKGRMQTQALIFDTSDTIIDGQGFIDMGEEVLDLKLVPRAKDFSLFSAEAPLYIKGTFSKILASPKFGEVLLSLATPIKPGIQDNADCQNLLKFIRQKEEKPKP